MSAPVEPIVGPGPSGGSDVVMPSHSPLAFYFARLTGRERKQLESCNYCGVVIVAGMAREHIKFHMELIVPESRDLETGVQS